ncbi:MAG: hypothetical protein Q9M91_04555 [Candidatus Dojkabacteria bacterium]|nr:hypothetical protein [Candidatus Dojkabacteria bacterium]MDQ7021083.1 hypothetical protein [Candidatus Dojkabacteria bacterium]
MDVDFLPADVNELINLGVDIDKLKGKFFLVGIEGAHGMFGEINDDGKILYYHSIGYTTDMSKLRKLNNAETEADHQINPTTKFFRVNKEILVPLNSQEEGFNIAIKARNRRMAILVV